MKPIKQDCNTNQPTLITNKQQISTEWLTTVLGSSEALSSGVVSSIDFTTMESNWASNVRMTVTYSDDAQGLLPSKLFLKMTNTDTGEGTYFDDSELAYYLRDYIDVADAPLVRCYDGVYSAEMHHYHLLLDDLSDTHTIALQKFPTFEHALALAEAFAIIHARWWGAERLAEGGIKMHSPSHIQRFIDIARPGLDHILGAANKSFQAADGTKIDLTLKSHWPDLMHKIFAQHPNTLINRLKDVNGFTLIHGDPNYTNILVPKEGDRPLYLIDRQPFDWSLTTYLALYDLIYVMILDWDVETRRDWEIPVLKHYHKALIERGIHNYSWDALIQDYQLCIPMGLYIATQFCSKGINIPFYKRWLNILQRTLNACDDHNCKELWNT